VVKETPSIIGARAELAVATGLIRGGYDVFTPCFNAHSRIDLIACGDAAPMKVQVKTSHLKRGAVCFWTCSNTKHVRQHYRDDVDAFGVYSPELGLVYLVPVDEVPLREASLRLEPARNNQRAKIRWAADYLIGPP
jgi:hypothetical protein